MVLVHKAHQFKCSQSSFISPALPRYRRPRTFWNVASRQGELSPGENATSIGFVATVVA